MKDLIIVKSYDGEGVGGELAANEYRCSFLNYLPRLVPERVVSMQKHMESDETFVLLTGNAWIFLADGCDQPDHIHCVKLEQEKSYTVPLGIWHAPVMSKDAKILLIENNSTSDDNSPRVPLSEKQKEKVRELGQVFTSAYAR